MIKLNVLEPNKTMVIYSCLEEDDTKEKDKLTLVRTGVMPDISSVIHCLLHATSREYVSSPNRVKLAERIRESLGDKLHKKEWRDTSTSLVAKIPFQDTLVTLWKDIYSPSGSSTSNREVKEAIKKNGEVYELLCQILPQKQLIEELLPKAFSKSADSNISVCKENIHAMTKESLEKALSAFGKKLDSERKRYCHKKLDELCEILCEEAEKVAMKEYENNFQKSMLEIDETVIGLLAEKFNRDIYCLDGGSRLPLASFCNKKDITRNRKAVVLIRITDIHYEVMGVLMSGSRVQREFEPTDPLIEKIYSFMYDQEKCAKRWPSLGMRLPTAKKIHFSASPNASPKTSPEKVEKVEKVEKAEKAENVEEKVPTVKIGQSDEKKRLRHKRSHRHKRR